MKHLPPSELQNARVLPGLGGKPFSKMLNDAYQTYDQATFDSAGAFLIGELERLDPKVHEPLVSVTWYRDIDLRTDVSMGDTSTSYIISAFAAPGGSLPSGINWASPQSTNIPRFQLDGAKIASPLEIWNGEVSYTLPELQSAQALGRPIDAQQLALLNKKHQMDVDQLVYIGDTQRAFTGILNSANVVNVSNVVAGGGGGVIWRLKTPTEILNDVNELIISVWQASGYSVAPSKILLPPEQFGLISTRVISDAGSQSILSYIKANNVLTAQFNIALDIQPVKWGQGALRGVASDRMVAYSQNIDFVRYPMVPLVPVQTQYHGIYVRVPYYGKLGVLETVYPETIGYRDGI